MRKTLDANLLKVNLITTAKNLEDLEKDLMLIYENDREFIKASFKNGNFILLELDGEIQLFDNW